MNSNTNSLIIYGYIISLFCDCLSSIIVASTQINSYNPFVIVFWCYLSKFLISLLIYCHQNYTKNTNVLFVFWQNCARNSSTFLIYSVPSLLYLLADILWYFNLSNLNPVTYSMLWQFRIVCTAIIHQKLFNRLLSKVQWISLIMLTTGCILKQLDTSLTSSSDAKHKDLVVMPYLMVLVQILFSCFAGVYNEYLLKATTDSTDSIHEHKKPLDLMVQNVFMYTNSMFFNLVIILLFSNLGEIPNFMSHVIFNEPKLSFVLFNTTFLGIMTSLFLKNLDSVFRTFGAVFQISFTAILGWILLNISINFLTLISILTVISSLIIYVKNPIITHQIDAIVDENSNEKLLVINENTDENVV